MASIIIIFIIIHPDAMTTPAKAMRTPMAFAAGPGLRTVATSDSSIAS